MTHFQFSDYAAMTIVTFICLAPVVSVVISIHSDAKSTALMRSTYRP